jgi:hypothetical protein
MHLLAHLPCMNSPGQPLQTQNFLHFIILVDFFLLLALFTLPALTTQMIYASLEPTLRQNLLLGSTLWKRLATDSSFISLRLGTFSYPNIAALEIHCMILR